MTACPSDRLLQLLVADELSMTEREPLEGHVEVCPHCQEILERLTGPGPDLPSGSWRKPGREGTPTEATAGPHLDFLAALARSLPHRANAEEKTQDEFEGSTFLLQPDRHSRLRDC